MKKGNKVFKKLLLVIPIIVLIAVYVISSYLFNKDRKQTYERVKGLRENQVQVLAQEMTIATSIAGETLEESEVAMLSKAVSEINKQVGVYCYLYDDECNRISGHTGGEDARINWKEIITNLESNNYKILTNEADHGYVKTTISTGEEFTIYWQGVPTGDDRDNCQYFIILGVSELEIQPNEAIETCKIFIGLLTIILCISLFCNITDENKK